MNIREDVSLAMEPRRYRRGIVFAFVLISTFITAIEQTIVATAMPAVAADLGDFSLYGWVFSGFMLSQAVSVPIFGRLADLYGRRPTMIAGLIIFMTASLLCGLAWSMPSLIAFRILQGLGAGAIQPIAVTMIGDLFKPQERPKAQAFISTVWALSAVLGPVSGGLIVQHGDWSWIFWVSIPVGIVVIVGFLAFFRETVERREHAIDYLGAALFSVAVGALLVLCVQGGIHWPWDSAPALVLSAVAAVTGILFIIHELRTAEPMVPLDMWKDRAILIATLGYFMTGVSFLGLLTFVPVYVQGVMGRSAIEAGLALTMMSLTWPSASYLVKYFARWFGERNTIRIGAIILALGMAVLLFVTPASSPMLMVVCTLGFGFGMGLYNTTTTIVVQHSVPWARRGSATGALFFSRILGGTLGVAILSGLLNGLIRDRLSEQGSTLALGRVSELLASPEGNTLGQVPPELLDALSGGLHVVFYGLVLASVLLVLIALMMPVTSAMVEDRPHKTG
jgi:EmrB/QacA subfamily drug resistance transporter